MACIPILKRCQFFINFHKRKTNIKVYIWQLFVQNYHFCKQIKTDYLGYLAETELDFNFLSK